MFFAMPIALIPFWADQLGTHWALGLLYAAGTIRGIICLIAVVILAGVLPKFRKFDIQTDEFALENQKMAEKLRADPQSEAEIS